MSREKEIEELVSQYGDLAKKLAWEHWKRLPASVKVWISPEDMIAEAYVCFVETIRERYDARRASKTTFIWYTLTNLFTNICKRHRKMKRFAFLFSLDDMMQWMGCDDRSIAQQHALDALAFVFYSATPECQEEMRRWFGTESCQPRRSAKVQKVYRQFTALAEVAHLSPNDCRELMRAGVFLP